MQQKDGFTLLTAAEFEGWLKNLSIARTIKVIQNHHTWVPGYQHFNGTNHFERMVAMRRSHMVDRGFADIGQHFTTFPDGTIGYCRCIEKTPACIEGFNTGCVCIEHLGNFDTGKDVMTAEHRASIILINAALCKRLGIIPTTDTVVYHHWYELGTGKRNDGARNNKTCPGTNFFGGNKVQDATTNFIPLIEQALNGSTPTANDKLKKYGFVTADNLNIRKGAAADSAVINSVPYGTILRIYNEKNGWYKIAAGKQEWVSSRFVTDVQIGKVTADSLNVRSGAGTAFNILRKLSKNNEVFVYAEQGNWLKIGIGEEWVSKDYVATSAV
jgi:uncharacterized protein YraI